MQLPLVSPAPIVEQHASAFCDMFENCCQFDHFQNYLTALMVLDNKSLSNMSRCILESADKTNLSRFLSQAPWESEKVNDRRVEYMISQTKAHQQPANASCLVIDDTLCEHVGSLIEHVARHDDHCEQRYPLAHNLVTSLLVSGAVRFPIDAKLYRRYEEKTEWEAYVNQQFPGREIPTTSKERQAFHKEVDPILLKDTGFKKLHEAFQTKIDLAMELVKDAIEHQLPFGVVLMDSWFLATDLMAILGQHKLDWVSLLKKNRNLETASFNLRDEHGQPIRLTGPHIKVEALVRLIPATAFRKTTIKDKDYWYFALNVRIPELGAVRIVISFDNPDLKGTYAVLISNRTDWSAHKIIQTYLQRWPIEPFYQDSKGHLGLDQYRMRTAEAFQKHWCLVFVAYSILHLDCLPASPLKRPLLTRPIKTIGEVCRSQGQLLIQKLILKTHDLMQQGNSAKEVFVKLFAKQQRILVN
jgi:SRSO17 transposase